VVSGVAQGDVGPRSEAPDEVLDARRQSLAAGRWRWLSQVHGDGVVIVGPDEACGGREADALVSTGPGAPLAVFAADCALVGLASPEGVLGAIHAGWRGLLAGVFERTATAMRTAGATSLVAVVGACIGPECYEFGEGDLARLERRFGSSVRSSTAAGRPALDLRAGVRRALDDLAVPIATEISECTACDPGWFSWRARKDTGRHALVVACPR
jgi:YfiH family protein